MNIILQLFLFLIFKFVIVCCFRCDRRPYGSTAPASPPDGRYQLNVLGVDNHAYLPEQVYTIQLTSTDGASTFTNFMISAEGDSRQDPKNPRRLITQFPGEIRPQSSETAKFSNRCLYSVEHAVRSWRTSVEVLWQAPPTGHGCVTLRAMVAENDETWYEDGSPLSQKICEDLRQPDDMSHVINHDCQICDEAKYEISFTGVWSRNTHPRFYPENVWIPKFSDLMGASHDTDFILWMPGSLAGEGLRQLAEHANSSKIESEIREKIGNGVRTLIKGKGHGYRRMDNPTFALFRADKTNHLVSVAVAIHPSPDWFLGVTRFELCQEDNTWLQERELNLYPWDAGTDSGVSYESPNIETYPQDTISRVGKNSHNQYSPFHQMDISKMYPFGKLHIKFIRSYHRECDDEGTTTEDPEGTTEASPDSGREPSPPSSETTVIDRNSTQECPMTEWGEWSLCEGPCKEGQIKGFQWRERFHLVNGVAIEKYDLNNDHPVEIEVPHYCKEHYPKFEDRDCIEDCVEKNYDDYNFEM